MRYEINVSKNGMHYFATAKRSLQCCESAAKVIAEDFMKRFPSREGFLVRLTCWEEYGKELPLPEAEAEAPEAYLGPSSFFTYHTCPYCKDGQEPCRKGRVSNCDLPYARND